jgi:hypothetical protein
MVVPLEDPWNIALRSGAAYWTLGQGEACAEGEGPALADPGLAQDFAQRGDLAHMVVLVQRGLVHPLGQVKSRAHALSQLRASFEMARRVSFSSIAVSCR